MSSESDLALEDLLARSSSPKSAKSSAQMEPTAARKRIVQQEVQAGRQHIQLIATRRPWERVEKGLQYSMY